MLRNHHIDEVYKRHALAPDVPRRGDLAAIVRDHHHTETGLTVRVVNDPHWAEVYCAECGQKVVEYFVEVHSDVWKTLPGPHFYPVSWLRRVRRMPER